MNWPPYSSDMNSIEHLWFLLKEKVYDVCSDIEKAGGDDEKIRETLFEALFKAWEQLDACYLHDLVYEKEGKSTNCFRGVVYQVLEMENFGIYFQNLW